MAESLAPGRPSKWLEAVAEALHRVRSGLGWAPDARSAASVEQGFPRTETPLGHLVVGDAPEEIERWAYGSSPWKSKFPGVSGRLPELQDRRKTAVVDAILAMPLGIAGKAAMAAPELGPIIGAAVKAKGGMWHPASVDSLADPLFGHLSNLPGGPRARMFAEPSSNEPWNLHPRAASDKAAAEWTMSRISNYLNKHAGTSTDPLKDIEVPFGEGTKRWEDVTDALIRRRPARQFRLDESLQSFKDVPPDEPVWTTQHNPDPIYIMSEYSALQSYLGHVGDYLRQNVKSRLSPVEWYVAKASVEFKQKLRPQGSSPSATDYFTERIAASPEYQKYVSENPFGALGNYDLVRAVRETAALDKVAMQELRKNLEARKAAAKKITDELPPEAIYKSYPEKGLRWVEISNKLDSETVALNVSVDTVLCAHCVGGVAHGKYGYKAWVPARDLVTREKVHPDLPDTNQYINDINSGESKIYSLRDGQGESHVTVEVGPVGSTSVRSAGAKPGDWESVIPDVLQIKGKQNRAPAAEYLPYVQDFVKSGKWGEVGDLGNTGLIQHQGQYLTREEAVALGNRLDSQGRPLR
jgi:hypothetical protein